MRAGRKRNVPGPGRNATAFGDPLAACSRAATVRAGAAPHAEKALNGKARAERSSSAVPVDSLQACPRGWRRRHRAGGGIGACAPAHPARRRRCRWPRRSWRCRVCAGIVERSRIRQALDASVDTGLTLVGAPAGYGKTTAVRGLVREPGWRAGVGHPRRRRQRPESDVEVRRDGGRSDASGLGRVAPNASASRGSPTEAAVDELMNGVDPSASP